MKGMEKYIPLTARVLLSLIFILSGFFKIIGFSGTVGFIESVGLPFAALGAVIAIVVELGAGIFLLLGFKAKLASYALIIYTAVATLIFHINLADQTQMVAFLKNLAIIGGLFLVSLHGPGPFSLDRKK